MMVRLAQEDEDGMVVRNSMLKLLWEDTLKRAKIVAVSLKL